MAFWTLGPRGLPRLGPGTYFSQNSAKSLVHGFALLLCALTLAACAWPELPKTWSLPFGLGDGDRQATQVAMPAVRFMAWQGTQTENDFITQALTGYAQTNPSLQIEYHLVEDYLTTLLDELDQPAPPDVFWVSGALLSQLTSLRVLAALSESQDEPVSAALSDAYQRLGVAYCRPRETFPLAVLYNKALLDDAGAAYPRPDWQWSDFHALAANLTEIETGRHGLVLPVELSRLLTFAVQAGVAIPAGPLELDMWNQQSLTSAIEFYLSLFANRYAVEPASLNSTWTGDALGRGAVAMTIEGSWILPYLKREYPDLDYGIAPLPAGPATNAGVVFTSCVGVHAKTETAGAAHGLAAYLSTPQHILDWGRLTGALPPQPDLHQAWLATFPTADPFVAALEQPLVWQWDAEEVAPYNTVIHTAVNEDWTAQELYERLLEVSPTVPISQ